MTGHQVAGQAAVVESRVRSSVARPTPSQACWPIRWLLPMRRLFAAGTSPAVGTRQVRESVTHGGPSGNHGGVPVPAPGPERHPLSWC